jgi:hypothetical protein
MSDDYEILLKRFYQALKDQPLEPGDRYYVPYLEQDPLHDPIANLRQRIAWSEAASVNLLSGQRGSGKSTGLRRLKEYLERDGCVVFLCDMRDYMNLTTSVEISDFFMSAMVGLSEAVELRYQWDPKERGYWARLWEFLNREIEFRELGVKADMADFKASLKDDPSFKEKLQRFSRGHLAALIKQAHGFGVEVVNFIRTRENDLDRKVVLLLDSIEQIRGVGADAKRVYDSVENLFSAHADSLRLNLLHLVYTIPPYLMPLVPGLGRYLGGGIVHTLPSVHVFRREGVSVQCNEDERGVTILRDIIARRCQQWTRVFSEVQIKRMACISGGDLRDFFRLIREVLVSASMRDGGGLPVADRLLDNAENSLRREMLPIAEEDKAWLRKISETKADGLAKKEELARLAGFFDTHLVLNYRNGDDWYDVHPLIRDVLG